MEECRVRRKYYYDSWSPASGFNGDFWRYEAPAPVEMPGWTNYSDVFEEYKVNKVCFDVIPRYNQFRGNNTTASTRPGPPYGWTNQGMTYLHVIVDPHTSNVSPGTFYDSGTFNDFCSNGLVESFTGIDPIRIEYIPTVDQTLGNAGAAVDRAARIPVGWMDTRLGDFIPMHGVHLFASDQNFRAETFGTFAFSGQSWDLFCTMDISFRRQR